MPCLRTEDYKKLSQDTHLLQSGFRIALVCVKSLAVEQGYFSVFRRFLSSRLSYAILYNIIIYQYSIEIYRIIRNTEIIWLAIPFCNLSVRIYRQANRLHNKKRSFERFLSDVKSYRIKFYRRIISR